MYVDTYIWRTLGCLEPQRIRTGALRRPGTHEVEVLGKHTSCFCKNLVQKRDPQSQTPRPYGALVFDFFGVEGEEACSP